MKKFSISIFVLCLLLFAGYYFSYQYHFQRTQNMAENTEEDESAEKRVDSINITNEAEAAPKTEGYYVCIKNGFVIVYEADKSTVYEYTDIIYDGLPEDLQEEIAEGKYMKDLKELYGFLENYSS